MKFHGIWTQRITKLFSSVEAVFHTVWQQTASSEGRKMSLHIHSFADCVQIPVGVH